MAVTIVLVPSWTVDNLLDRILRVIELLSAIFLVQHNYYYFQCLHMYLGRYTSERPEFALSAIGKIIHRKFVK